MKKLDNKGFILAETLVVSVFLMVLFTMIYSNFYPLIGEYEKRENYDDVDGKYTAYWIKKIIESSAYTIDNTDIAMMNKWGYIRFECSNVSADNNQKDTCINLVTSLEIANCDGAGNGCDAFITRYTIGGNTAANAPPNFKDRIRDLSIRRWNEACATNSNPMAATPANTTGCAAVAFQNCCKQKGLTDCTNPVLSETPNYASLYSDPNKTAAKTAIAEYCNKRMTQKSFTSATKDYILSLPNYSIPHTTTGAKYRVIVVVHHKKDNNDYYSFSTMEVIK